MPESFIQTNVQVARPEQSELSDSEVQELHAAGLKVARSSAGVPGKHYSSEPRELYRHSVTAYNKLDGELYAIGTKAELSPDLRSLFHNLRLIRIDIQNQEEVAR